MRIVAALGTTLVALVLVGSVGSALARDDRNSDGKYSREYQEDNVVQQGGEQRFYRTGVTFDTRPPGCTPIGGPYFECYGQILERRAGQYEIIEVR
jgi:hypothetical protein